MEQNSCKYGLKIRIFSFFFSFPKLLMQLNEGREFFVNIAAQARRFNRCNKRNRSREFGGLDGKKLGVGRKNS